MTKSDSIKHFFKYEYSDVHRGTLAALSCIIAMFIGQYFKLSFYSSLWLIISASLSCISLQGSTKWQQTLNLVLLSLLTSLFMVATTFLHNTLGVMLFLPLLFILLFVVLSIPRLIPGMALGATLIAAYMIMNTGLNLQPARLTWIIIWHQILALTSGTLICALINLILPKNNVTTIPIDQTNYFFKRVFRICLGVIIGFCIAKRFELQHPSWICFTVLLVSQSNLGASIKRALHRFAGTIAGVLLGIPATIWVFSPHPFARWLALPAFMLSMIVIKRYYYIGIFLLTFLLSAAYYAIVPSGVGGVDFILYRLFDTFLGVIIAIAVELTIFPRRLIDCLRKYHWAFWDALYLFFLHMQQQQTNEIINYSSKLESELNKIDSLLSDIKYEPMGYLTMKYHMFIILMSKLHELVATLAVFQSKSLPQTILQSDYFAEILQILQQLTEFNQRCSKAVLVRILSDCSHSLLLLYNRMKAEANTTSESHLFLGVTKELLAIIQQYHFTLALSPWRLYLG